MSCADIEAFVARGWGVNASEHYTRADNEARTTKSLIERAVELGCAPTVRLLIGKGATLENESIWDFYVDVPLRHHRERLASLPLEDEEINGNCLLFLWSLFFQNIEVSRILHDAFVTPCEKSLQERTMLAAMTLAVEIGNLDVLHFLLELGGADFINSKESFYPTPFHEACLKCELKIAKILFEHGADPNIATIYADVPLTDAIFNSEEEMALWLIENGAQVDIQLKNRSKPLSMAKKRKLKRVVAAIEAKLQQAP